MSMVELCSLRAVSELALQAALGNVMYRTAAQDRIPALCRGDGLQPQGQKGHPLVWGGSNLRLGPLTRPPITKPLRLGSNRFLQLGLQSAWFCSWGFQHPWHLRQQHRVPIQCRDAPRSELFLFRMIVPARLAACGLHCLMAEKPECTGF